MIRLGYLLLIRLLFFTSCTAQSSVNFALTDLPPGVYEEVGLRGNLPPLSWGETLPLSKRADGFAATIDFLPADKALEFKFVYQVKAGDPVVWEGIENRILSLNTPETEYVGSWNEPLYLDPASLPLFSIEALQKDYHLIETIFREVHPGTYRYLTEEELTANLARLHQRFSESLSTAEAYLAINEFTATIRCEHTASPRYNQSAPVASMLHLGRDKLPFTFRWRDGRMIVLQDATAGRVLPPGSEVLAINGVPAGEILHTLRKYIGSDGPSVDPVNGILSLRGYPWRLEAFDAVYHLVYPVSATGISLSIQTSTNTEPITKVVTPVRRRDRAAILTSRYPDFPAIADDLWSLEIKKDRTAVLTVGDFTGFGVGALKLDYEVFFAEAFRQIAAAGVDKLIVDVRENQGGNDPIVLELFSYFDYKANPQSAFEGRMRYQTFPYSLRPYVKTWGKSTPDFFEPKPGKPDDAGQYYIYPTAFISRPTNTKPGAFTGELVFLTGRINASLGFYLANNVRRSGVGKIFGETTGGSLRGINGGNLALLRLPGTDLELDFPVLGGFATNEQPAHGVVPDVLITITAADQLLGGDPVMDAAVKYLADH